jgi:predicted metal-dependent hydrolase
MEALVHSLNNNTFQTHITDVRLSYATTQWGSCSPRGHIMLNAALLFVPEHLLHYVIVHELAHRLYPNHSKAYWREVARFYPEYEAARKEMRRFRLLAL